MTAFDDRPPVPPAVRVLQLVGIILILTFFLDFAVRLFAADFANDQWQLTMMNEFIDRGVMPLIGLALIYAGVALKQSAGIAPVGKSNAVAWADPNFWTFVFASLLGLLFLLVIPFHHVKTGELADQGKTKLNEQVDQQERGIDQEKRQLEQRKQLLQAISRDPQQIDQVLQRSQLQPQEKARWEQLKQQDEPSRKQAVQNALLQIDEQLQRAQTLETELETQKQKTLTQLGSNRVMAGFRAALRSVLLAFGFAWIGWTGLRDSR